MSGNRSGWLTWPVVLAMAIGAGALGGCQNNRLHEERQQLYSQNTELQSELNKTRAALEAAENDRNTTAAELERLRAELAAAEARAAAAQGQQYPEGGLVVHQTRTAAATGSKQPFSDLGPGVEVVRGQGRITVRLPGDVLFAPGKADLNTSAKSTLAKIAKTLNGAERGHPIRVEGYTDTDPIRHSKWKSNQELSEARAGAVAKYLEQQGVAGARVTTVGYGATKPRETKAKSRRVEIVILTSK